MKMNRRLKCESGFAGILVAATIGVVGLVGVAGLTNVGVGLVGSDLKRDIKLEKDTVVSELISRLSIECHFGRLEQINEEMPLIQSQFFDCLSINLQTLVLRIA